MTQDRSGWCSVPVSLEIASQLEPGAVAFGKSVIDGHLLCLIGRDPDTRAWHLSLSHRRDVLDAQGHPVPGRLPTWAEVFEARYRFLPDKATMAMILPPRAEYVNLMPTCFHLYEVPG